MKSTVWILLAIAVGVFGFKMGHNLSYEEKPAQSTTVMIPGPESMDALVGESEFIVLAWLGPVVNESIFYGYDENAEQRKEIEAESGVILGREIIDYELQVAHVFKDDGNGEKDQPRILRLFQDHDQELRNLDLFNPKEGEQRLFFLGLNPDGKTYGLRSEMHQVLLDGEYATYPSGAERLPVFNQFVEPGAFTKQILETVYRQNENTEK